MEDLLIGQALQALPFVQGFQAIPGLPSLPVSRGAHGIENQL